MMVRGGVGTRDPPPHSEAPSPAQETTFMASASDEARVHQSGLRNGHRPGTTLPRLTERGRPGA